MYSYLRSSEKDESLELPPGTLRFEPAPEAVEEAIDMLFEPPTGNLAPSTRHAYHSAWRDFEAWCEERGRSPVPAPGAHVARFLVSRGALTRSTLKKRRAAIGFVHEELGFDNPAHAPPATLAWEALNEKKGLRRATGKVRETLEAGDVFEDPLHLLRKRSDPGEPHPLLREGGPAPTHEAGPPDDVLTEEQRALVGELPARIEPSWDAASEAFRRAARDWTLLLAGAVAKLSRSEILRLRVDDLRVAGPDLVVVATRDPDGDISRAIAVPRPRKETVPFDVARAAAAWVLAAEIEEGPLARSLTRHGEPKGQPMSPYGFNVMLKRRAEEAGLDPGEWSARRLKEGPAPR